VAAGERGYRLLIMTDQEGGRVLRLPGGVADVNTVGSAGVIGDRAFGTTPDLVARMVAAQVCGYHDGGIATTIKHWPGHGATTTDSHTDLPTLVLPVRRWRRVHLPPFRQGVASGTDLVMVGHLALPALDPSGLPATLSPVLTRHWLRQELGFRGVVITDALTMGALQAYGSGGAVALRAFRAGADLLLMPRGPVGAARRLVEAVRSGEVRRTSVVRAVERVRLLEDRLGLVPGVRQLESC
jgi:beta-N-acetylhexosaminidase